MFVIFFSTYDYPFLVSKMDRDRVGVGAERGQARPTSALKKLEQWLVGFPCRILIRCVMYPFRRVGMRCGHTRRYITPDRQVPKGGGQEPAHNHKPIHNLEVSNTTTNRMGVQLITGMCGGLAPLVIWKDDCVYSMIFASPQEILGHHRI